VGLLSRITPLLSLSLSLQSSSYVPPSLTHLQVPLTKPSYRWPYLSLRIGVLTDILLTEDWNDGEGKKHKQPNETETSSSLSHTLSSARTSESGKDRRRRGVPRAEEEVDCVDCFKCSSLSLHPLSLSNLYRAPDRHLTKSGSFGSVNYSRGIWRRLWEEVLLALCLYYLFFRFACNSCPSLRHIPVSVIFNNKTLSTESARPKRHHFASAQHRRNGSFPPPSPFLPSLSLHL
jgi:hypothetical protein